VTLSLFPIEAFRWTKGGNLDTFHSSEKVHRHRCRSSLDVGDEPGHPTETLRHAFWADRVNWIAINDDVHKVKGFAAES